MKTAFKKFDSDGSGEASVDDMLRSGYSAKAHPDVVSRVRTERQVLTEMLAKFEGGVGDGLITEDEFLEFYAKSVSPSIDNDDHFVMLIRKACVFFTLKITISCVFHTKSHDFLRFLH